MFTTETRILVVDDMMTMRKLVQKVCRELGFKNMTEAPDGQLAWQIITEANPAVELVISDWNMPNCTGIDLLKRVRADSRYVQLPFVMVTAESESHQVAEAIKAGVSSYLVKPFTAGQLKDKLAAINKKLAA